MHSVKQPTVFIVVLTWNQCDLTCACIASLLQIRDATVQVVVVDNGSTDGTLRTLTEKFGTQVQLLPLATNLGYAGGNNAGIQHCLEQGADYIMVLNNDTIVDADFLEPLLRRLSLSQNIGVVTPKIYFLDEPERIWAVGGAINLWLGRAYSRGRMEKDCGQYDEAIPVAYATGCCFLGAREVFLKVGTFEEQYFAYFEDTDWSQRVQEAGWEVWYEPQSVIWHKAGGSSATATPQRKEGNRSPFLIYLLTRNNLWFIGTHIKGFRKPVATLAFFVRHIILFSVSYILLRRWRKLQSLWQGVYDGLTPPLSGST